MRYELPAPNWKDSIEISNYSVATGLVSDCVFDIYEDSYKRLWLAMAGGISVMEFSENNESINVTKLIEGRDIPSNFILCIADGDFACCG